MYLAGHCLHVSPEICIWFAKPKQEDRVPLPLPDLLMYWYGLCPQRYNQGIREKVLEGLQTSKKAFPRLKYMVSALRLGQCQVPFVSTAMPKG